MGCRTMRQSRIGAARVFTEGAVMGGRAVEPSIRAAVVPPVIVDSRELAALQTDSTLSQRRAIVKRRQNIRAGPTAQLPWPIAPERANLIASVTFPPRPAWCVRYAPGMGRTDAVVIESNHVRSL